MVITKFPGILGASLHHGPFKLTTLRHYAKDVVNTTYQNSTLTP